MFFSSKFREKTRHKYGQPQLANFAERCFSSWQIFVCFGRFFPGSRRKPPFQKWLDDVQSTLTRKMVKFPTFNRTKKMVKLPWTFWTFRLSMPPRKILRVKTLTFVGMVSKNVT